MTSKKKIVVVLTLTVIIAFAFTGCADRISGDSESLPKITHEEVQPMVSEEITNEAPEVLPETAPKEAQTIAPDEIMSENLFEYKLIEIIDEYGLSSLHTTFEWRAYEATFADTAHRGLISAYFDDFCGNGREELITAVLTEKDGIDFLNVDMYFVDDEGNISKTPLASGDIDYAFGEQPPTVFIKHFEGKVYLCVAGEGGNMYFGGSSYGTYLSVIEILPNGEATEPIRFWSGHGPGMSFYVWIEQGEKTLYQAGPIYIDDPDSDQSALWSDVYAVVDEELMKYGLEDQIVFFGDGSFYPGGMAFEYAFCGDKDDIINLLSGEMNDQGDILTIDYTDYSGLRGDP